MWPAIIVASLGCYAIKLLGLSLPGKVVSNPRVTHIADLLPVALFTAVISPQPFTSGHHLQLDARAAGLVAAVIAVRLKAPFLVVVFVACAVAALLRLAA